MTRKVMNDEQLFWVVFFSFFVMTVVVVKSLKLELDFKGKAQSLLDDKKINKTHTWSELKF